MAEKTEFRSPQLEEVGKTTQVDATARFDKMTTVHSPPHSFKTQQLKARANTVPINMMSSTDDDVFHHLAVQLNRIDTLGHRDGSRAATPELSSSPNKIYSPDPAAASIDLVHYSGIGGSIDNIEAASNKYFELPETEEESPEDPLQEKRERHTSTGDVPMPSVLKATGVCARLDYPRVNITGKNDMSDFAGVSLFYSVTSMYSFCSFFYHCFTQVR